MERKRELVPSGKVFSGRSGAVMRFLSKFDGWVCNGTHRFLGFLEDRLAPFTLVVLVAELTFAILFWCWLSARESGSTTIRNLGLLIAATIGLPLAIWRSKVAERQAKTAQRQSDIAQLRLLDERCQRGTDMLRSKTLSDRLGGIDVLARLAREYPGDYHMQIMSLFCAFVRHPVAGEAGNDRQLLAREDVQAVMTAVRERSKSQIKIDKEEEYRLNLFRAELVGVNLAGTDLVGAYLMEVKLNNAVLTEAKLNRAYLMEADLRGATLHGADLIEVKLNNADLVGADLLMVHLISANLTGANLTSADLTSANLTGAKLVGAKLADADLFGANLMEAKLPGANLANAHLVGANLSGADLRGCKGLTQEQIDQAVAFPDNLPDLTDVVDANTGEPLFWCGSSPSG